MLRARAGARHDERQAQAGEPAREAGEAVSGRRQHRAENQDATRAKPALGQTGRRDLQRRHRGRIQSAQPRERAIAEPELRLPDRQQHVDHIAEAVVQRMGEASARQRPAGMRGRFGGARMREIGGCH